MPNEFLQNANAIRPQYEEHGATGFYEKFGASYRNPHEAVIQTLIERATSESKFDFATTRVLDLACGSGEATLALRVRGFQDQDIDGVDPFTGAAYFERTGQNAEAISFEEIARGVLSSRRYDLCVCSFALHLAPVSVLPNLCLQLALICKTLWVLTPHKRPHIKEDWGWQMKDEMAISRVRLRVYETLLNTILNRE